MDLAYYLRSNPDFARVRVPSQHPSGPDFPAQLEAITSVQKRHRIWYLDDKGPLTEAQAAVLDWLRAHYTETEGREFTNVGVVAFSPRAESR